LSQKHFTKVIIASSPLYANLVDEDGQPVNYEATWDRYTKYKRMVPTCGVILINAKESKVSVAVGFEGAT
jgi:mRNA-decapping enzyme subunit 2